MQSFLGKTKQEPSDYSKDELVKFQLPILTNDNGEHDFCPQYAKYSCCQSVLGPWVALSRISVRDRKSQFPAFPLDVQQPPYLLMGSKATCGPSQNHTVVP